MVLSYRNRVAFITGGGSGIGFRIAEIFMRLAACNQIIVIFHTPYINRLTVIRESLHSESLVQSELYHRGNGAV